jgi:DNA topoisomerase-1
MEEELDEIEEGKLKWTDALREFYDKFEGDLKSFRSTSKTSKRRETCRPTRCV